MGRHAPSVAVIGAGMAGLSCAQRLQKAGLDAHVFEADHEPGGRVSYQRVADRTFDDGAQFFTVRSQQLQAQMAVWLANGTAAPWQPTGVQGLADPWYVGVPHMRALTDSLAQRLHVYTNTPISQIQPQGRGWQLFTPQGAWPERYDAVAIATSAPQAASLLQPHALPWAQRMQAIPFLPCVTLLFSTADVGAPAQAHMFTAGAVAWWSRNDSKPGRQSVVDRNDWVIQASVPWSQQFLHESDPVLCQALLAQWQQIVGCDGPLPALQVHGIRRWPQARRCPQEAVWADSLWSAPQRLGVCGDGLSHSRVEQAYVSGYKLAEQMIDYFQINQQETR